MSQLPIADQAARLAMCASRLPPFPLRFFGEYVDGLGEERFALTAVEVGSEGQLQLRFHGGETAELWGPDTTSVRPEGVVIAHADRVRWTGPARAGAARLVREYEALPDGVRCSEDGVPESVPAAGRLLRPALELL